MFRNNSPEAKSLKTALLLGVFNLIISPLVPEEENAGLIFGIALNTLALLSLHELGRSRRPGSNLLSNASSNLHRLFSSDLDADLVQIHNYFRNIINGGAAVTDIVVEKVNHLINRRG